MNSNVEQALTANSQVNAFYSKLRGRAAAAQTFGASESFKGC